jgi:ADP-ribosylation factor-like protein 1
LVSICNAATAFNVETVDFKNVKFKVWDLAGQSGIRPYWRSYYTDTQAVIFVIDSTDRNRLPQAKQEFLMMLEVTQIIKHTIIYVYVMTSYTDKGKVLLH